LLVGHLERFGDLPADVRRLEKGDTPRLVQNKERNPPVTHDGVDRQTERKQTLPEDVRCYVARACLDKSWL